MKNVFLCLLISALNFLTFSASAGEKQTEIAQSNMMDELNPFDPNIDLILEQMSSAYEAQTGLSSILEGSLQSMIANEETCVREKCTVWISVSKSAQRATLYINGIQQSVWKVSTGTDGHGTPDFDKHPNGRIYDEYTSTKFPGGDYNGLGNMPYAVFIQGGFAIHGTGQNNWPRLGSRASHGCIRLHPDNGFIFNRLVRKHGIQNTWITVY